MKKDFLLLFLLVICFCAKAQQQTVLYDESKVPTYVLPTLLATDEAVSINTAQQWEELRRPELVELFSREMYGRTPAQQIDASYEKLFVNPTALDGIATSKQIRITFSNGADKRSMLLLIYLPNQVKSKVPIFFAYNFLGNETVFPDEDIIPSTNAKRGTRSNRWSIEMILSAGYGVATAFYGDVFPDDKDKHAQSILPLFGIKSKEDLTTDSWQAIGAWAWGMSRVMDYCYIDPQIDESRVVLMGHSRQGKAALWAGAQDPRFAIVISNNSGCGGAALSKRVYGETIGVITSAFPHWFCKNFNQYSNNEQKLPFDQHQLLALIAPRPLYVTSAEEDKWADPRGEYLSAYYAGEVYELYGFKGLESSVMPSLNTPVMNRVGYHIRTGVHDVTAYDWEQFILFANKWLNR